jgi:hypothetical protein
MGGWGGDEVTGGAGGKVQALVPVTPGSTYVVRVGGAGGSCYDGADGGWPNGGVGATSGSGGGGGGGGSSSIALGSAVIVEAGAGGGAGDGYDGGPGGTQGGGAGGIQSGGDGSGYAGGGGGGWNGGSGGSADDGGAGGTSRIAVGSGTVTPGASTGDGSVIITWDAPDLSAPVTTSDAQTTYDTQATINLSATDLGGSGLASINYSLDGGVETEGTVVIVDPPANGTDSHTLRFWSVDRAGNRETAQSVSFDLHGAPLADSHDIRVRVLQGGAPVEGVNMVICTTQDPTEKYASWDWGEEVLTDADGYAVWPDMPGVEGGYRVRATDYAVKTFLWQAVPGYDGELPEPELDLDAESISMVHVTVRDSDGNTVSDAEVEAVFDDDTVALDPTQTDPVTATSDGDGNCQLDLYPTHQALRMRVVANGDTTYSDEFHADTFGGEVYVDVTVP